MEFEKFNVTPYEHQKNQTETIKSATEFRDEAISLAERLVEHQTGKIGEGKTAEVHFDNSNNHSCFKIITNPFGAPYVNKVRREGRLLNDAYEIDSDVKVPEPQYFIDTSYYTHNETGSMIEKKASILLMERLDAITLKEILEGSAPLPKEFSTTDFMDKFFTKLEEFVSRLHERGIYHRDLHEGNIMMDVSSGQPCVIDFGASTYATDYDAYRDTDSATGETIIFTETDEERVEQARRALLQYCRSLDKEKYKS
jgi:serine/threonine protein kinase